MDTSPPAHELRILRGTQTITLVVRHGTNLRRVLLAAHCSPYTALTRHTNCGGRGLCATCGVGIEQGEPPPRHWHDWLAARFGYPRLSCQIAVCAPMTVRLLTDKLIWGARDPQRRYWPGSHPGASAEDSSLL